MRGHGRGQGAVTRHLVAGPDTTADESDALMQMIESWGKKKHFKGSFQYSYTPGIKGLRV